MAFVKEPVEFIETAPNRIEVCCATQVPLAKQASDVSGIYQHISQSFFAHRQTRPWVFVVAARWIEFITESCLVASG